MGSMSWSSRGGVDQTNCLRFTLAISIIINIFTNHHHPSYSHSYQKDNCFYALLDCHRMATQSSCWIWRIKENWVTPSLKQGLHMTIMKMVVIRGWRVWQSTSWRSSVKSRLRFHPRPALTVHTLFSPLDNLTLANRCVSTLRLQLQWEHPT